MTAYFSPETDDRYPMALDSGKFGTFKLAPGEYQVMCPYEKSHRALNTRVCKHLEKCRRNYRVACAKRGEEPVVMFCQYYKDHVVLAPEIYLHECICRQVYMKAQVFVNFIEMRSHAPDVQLPEGVKLEDIYAHFKCQPLERTYPEGKVLWTNPSSIKADLATLYTPVDPKNLQRARKIAQMKKQAALREMEKKVRFSGDKNLRVEDLEEYWEPDETIPIFYWLDHRNNLPRPTLSIPSGMTRAQRRSWIDENTIRFERELGRIQEVPEEEAHPII